MKKRLLIIVAAAASLLAVAEARTITTWVFGSATAQEDDRDAAVSEATDQATQQANIPVWAWSWRWKKPEPRVLAAATIHTPAWCS